MRFPAGPETRHHIDVRSSSVLARTQISLIGVLDGDAIDTIDEAVHLAQDNGHVLTITFGESSAVTPDAWDTLLSRNHRRRFGQRG